MIVKKDSNDKKVFEKILKPEKEVAKDKKVPKTAEDKKFRDIFKEESKESKKAKIMINSKDKGRFAGIYRIAPKPEQEKEVKTPNRKSYKE